MGPSVDVVVMGGGIAGLSTAYELALAGVSFVVLEAGRRLGGIIFSEHVDGFTIDAGPDSLLVQKPDGIKLCEELGLGDRLISTSLPRLSYIQRSGRLYPLPAGSVLGIPTRILPFIRSPLFSWAGKIRMGAELFVPARHDGRDESIGDFMRRRFGREAVDYIAEPLLAGIHAGDVDRLSMRALFPRVFEAEQHGGSVIRALRQPNPQSLIPNRDGVFRSLPGGLSELVTAVVAKIGRERIRTSAPVMTVMTVMTVAGHRLYDVRTATDTFTARSVVFATPAYVTASLFADRDAAISGLCAEVPYVSVATVVLAFDRRAVEHPLNGSGFVVPRVESSAILAASWLSSKWRGRAPADRVLMRTFVGGVRDRGAIDRSDSELVAESVSALRPLIGITREPLFSRVYRWPRANAQHEVGHLDRMAALDAALARHPGLFVTGSGFRGVGIPDCIADGRTTARAAIRFLKSATTEATEEHGGHSE